MSQSKRESKRTKKPKPQVSLNLHTDVYRWFRREQSDHGASKTKVGLAAIVALRLMQKDERSELYRWASLLDDGGATWADFEAVAEKNAKDRAKASLELLRAVLDSED